MTPPPEVNIAKHAFMATCVSVAVVAPIAWMLLDRDPPYTYPHVEITPHDVEQGGMHDITFTTIQNRVPCGPGLVYREYQEASGKLHTFTPVMRTEIPELDENGRFTREGILPEFITEGRTIYRGKACYVCNPVHWLLDWPVCAVTPDVEFNVVKKR